MQDVARSAVRVDADGIHHRVELVGSPGTQIFVATTAPVEATGTVVICSSLHAEFLKSYRREFELARECARRGLAVTRFHYPGTGHSEGEPGTESFDVLLTTARAVVDRALTNHGSGRLALLGTRFGALVGAALTREYDVEALAFWEPTLNARQYLREAVRFGRMSDIRRATDGNSAEPEPRGDDASTYTEVLGYSIPVALIESTRAYALDATLADRARRILAVQFRRAGKLRTELGALVDQWRQSGAAVDVIVVPKDEPWWLSEDPLLVEVDYSALVNKTAAWLTAGVSGGAA